MKWEQIDAYHQRAEVFGGWLVKCVEDVIHFTPDIGIQHGHDWRVAMTFVPDPAHEWVISK